MSTAAAAWDFAYWNSAPERTRAIVVGVGEYDHPDYADLPGAAQGAVAFAGWLLDRGVPPENIVLLAKPTAGLEIPEGLHALRPDYKEMDETFDNLSSSEGDLLWFYWAGHGGLTEGSTRLILADATEKRVRNLNFDGEIRPHLGTSWMQSLPRQIFLVDACRTANENLPKAQPVSDKYGNKDDCRQITLLATEPRDAAQYSYSEEGGVFTRVLLDVLNDLDRTSWPPDLRSLKAQLESSALGESSRLSCPFTIDAPWGSERGSIGRPYRRPSTRRGLSAYVVPPDWQAGAPNERFSSAAVVRLDLRLGLDRAGGMAVVADPADADLASDLDGVEALVEEHASVPVEPRRRWFTIDVETAGEPIRAIDPLQWTVDGDGWQSYAGPSDDRRPGFVVQVPAGVALDRAARVTAWTRLLAERFPGASVVVNVHAARPSAGIAAALRFATELDQSQPVEDGWCVFSRLRPGEPASPAAADDPPPRPTLPWVLDSLRGEAARSGRSLAPLLSAACGSGADSSRTSDLSAFSAEGVAGHLLAELEATPDFPDELLLCAVRDFAEWWYQPLLRRYAASRSGRGWGASLFLASAVAGDLDGWLAAARSAGRELSGPGDLLARHLRTAAPAIVYALGRAVPPTPVDVLGAWVSLVGRPEPDEEPPSLGAWTREEYWREARRQPLTPQVIRELTNLAGRSPQILAIPGLAASDGLEGVLADQVAHLRTVLRYVPYRATDDQQ